MVFELQTVLEELMHTKMLAISTGEKAGPVKLGNHQIGNALLCDPIMAGIISD